MILVENNEIIVICQEVGKIPIMQKIKNNISNFEELLGGEIQIIPYEDIYIICRKDRKKLKPNIYINTKFLSIGENIRGNIVITSKDNEKFKSLDKAQAIKYLEFLENASFHYDNVATNRKVIRYKDSNSKTKEKNDSVLEMILSIQTIILKYIESNKN